MIDLFVFDLGNVILPFNHLQIVPKLRGHCANGRFSEEEIFRYMFDFEKGLINRYEEGRMSSLEFFLVLRDRYGLELDFEQFKEIWNNIFWDNQEVNEIIAYLKARGFTLLLLSNTNELHFCHILEQYPIVHLFDDWILSFEVGAKKPEQRIFQSIFEKADVLPEKVFYIDDVAEYIEAARRMGIKGHVFKGADELWQALREVI